MKKPIYKTLLLITLSLSSAHAADYSKCQDVINPHRGFGNGGQGGGFGFSMAPYLPFSLQKDGKIKPHDDVISYKYDDDKKQDTIVYEMPTYDFMTPEDLESSNPYKQKMRRVTVTIQRDDKGEITEIKNDQNISQADIDKQVKMQREMHERNTSEEMRKQWKESFGDDYQLPFYGHSSTTIKFEIKNGQCVPVKSVNTALVEPKKDGQTFDTTNYNLNLCKDIDNFLKKNPDAASCFKKDLNKEVSSIFDKYIDQKTQYPGQMGGFGMGGFMGGPYGGYGSFGLGSLEQQLNHGKFWGNEDQKQNIRKTTGSSPVITSHMILQNCYNQGLGSFIDDPKIWEKTGVKQSSSPQEENVIKQ